MADWRESADDQVERWSRTTSAFSRQPFGAGFPHTPPPFLRFVVWSNTQEARRDPRLILIFGLALLGSVVGLVRGDVQGILIMAGSALAVFGLGCLLAFIEYATVWGAPWAAEQWSPRDGEDSDTE